MYCDKCGASLPSHGFICKNCGAMMSKEQIREQKNFLKENKDKKQEITFLSDRYSNEPIKRDYSRQKKENKYLGGLLILLVLIILIIIAILKVM